MSDKKKILHVTRTQTYEVPVEELLGAESLEEEIEGFIHYGIVRPLTDEITIDKEEDGK